MSKKYDVIVDKILSELGEFEGFYDRDYYLEFEERISAMKDKILESQKEGRLLKIGIVGEVKAGKSSFLNALIFDGADILPKASTPMTAALTKITYADKPSARIVFYSEKDWERVENLAFEYDKEVDRLYQEYLARMNKGTNLHGGYGYKNQQSKEQMRTVFDSRISLKLRSCKELVLLADESKIDIREYLGKTLMIDSDQIKNGLEDYIGASGSYTAIVKHVELQMNNPMLEGVEIVDTPGLNDPIISRGETTKKFLRECDVVFLLSYCGQFLTQEDISFMCNTIPNEGIRNVILVGSKFDSGILDDTKSKLLKQACSSSVRIYNEQARENIDKCLKGGCGTELLERMKGNTPSYVSALLFSCAKKKKNGEPLSETEFHILKAMKKQFSDFQDDYKTLLSLSGIVQIRNKLSKIQEQKQSIIDERNKEVLEDSKKQLLKVLEEINIQVIQNKEDFVTYDKDKLEKKLYDLQSKLNSMRREIRNIFENSSADAEKFLNNMAVTIDAEIENYVNFEVNVQTKNEQRTYRTGFLGLKKVHYIETVTTYSAKVSDVISNMRKYITRCKSYSNEEFEKIINLNKLESAVKDTVIGAFDLSGKDFNEKDILIPLEIVIKKIKIPQIDISVDQFENMIIDVFSDASVKGEAIHQLELLENRALGKIAEAIKEELKKCRSKIENVMAEQASTFVDNIIEKLSDNMNMLKNQIENKENSRQKYEMLCQIIIEAKKNIKEMEM